MLIFCKQLLLLPVVRCRRGGGYFFLHHARNPVCRVRSAVSKDGEISASEKKTPLIGLAVDLDQSPHFISETRRGSVIKQVIRPEIVAHRCDYSRWDEVEQNNSLMP